MIDGEAIGDSTAIIAALEERFPEPRAVSRRPKPSASAPSPRGVLRHELGPHVRTAGFHELRRDRERFAEFSRDAARAACGRAGSRGRSAAKVGAAYTQFGSGSPATMRPRGPARASLAALDRLEAELEAGEPGDYMAGGGFSVADLSAAALLAPIVQPPQGPEVPVTPPPAFEEFRATISGRRGYRWVEETFARHRGDPRRP